MEPAKTKPRKTLTFTEAYHGYIFILIVALLIVLFFVYHPGYTTMN